MAIKQSVSDAVITVVANYKNVDPHKVKPSQKLSDWNFSRTDRRDLAQKINLYFFDILNMVFDRWLHPRDTDADQEISKVIKKVRNLHPRPRGGGHPTPA